MPTNWYLFFATALIPLIIGFFWYGNMGFGKKWMRINGFTEESLAGANMGVIMGLSYVFGIFISLALSGIVIHQTSVFQVMMPGVAESGSAAQAQFNDLMATYGNNFRDFGHGALHGGFLALMLAFPLIAINSLFERRGWAYIGIHTGYWFIVFLLIGGVLCQFLQYAPAS